MREDSDPYCLRAGDAQKLLHGHPWKRFVALGDSVAEGIGDPVPGYSDLPWCDRIAAELGVEYLNLGKRSLRAAEVLASQLNPALEFRPDLALVVCGANDVMAMAYNPDRVDAALTAIITSLKQAGAEVITVSIFDVSLAPCFSGKVKTLMNSRMRTLSDRTLALSRQLGTIHVNCYGHPAEGDPAMYSSDGLHGNMRSHQIFATEAIRALGTHFRRFP